jgi:hypothetical protein
VVVSSIGALKYHVIQYVTETKLYRAEPQSRFHMIRVRQRIWINNRSPRSTFCRWKLLQILSACVLSALPPPPPTPCYCDHPPSTSCFPSPRHTQRENLEQFWTTESLAWASVINSYSLGCSVCIWLKWKLSETDAKLFSPSSKTERFVLLVTLRSKPIDFRCETRPMIQREAIKTVVETVLIIYNIATAIYIGKLYT